MATSKEVFEKRKTGQTYEAYQMAQELVRDNPNDPWNVKALAWCLVDLIKEASNRNDDNSLRNFITELNRLNIDRDDIITVAKILSKVGRHRDAVNTYKTALKSFPIDISIHEGLGWELYRVGKDIFSAEKIDVYKAKQLLNEYIKLKNERPSILHSLFLRYADKLIGSEGFNLVAFLRFWNLDNLTQEDYKPYRADNGKTYPSVAEKIIQHAAKDALSRNILNDMHYILPYINNAIDAFPKNFWLTYYKTKLLLSIGENHKAYEFAISVVKAKPNDYWAWDLLAETLVGSDTEKALACYSKSLSCRSDEKFLTNVRMKFADLLIQKSLYREAKFEIDQAIKSREHEGWKLTEAQLTYMSSEWYQNTTSTKDNRDFYKQYNTIAEAILFDPLPWINASLGNTFTTAKNPDKQKRKIYVALAHQSTPIEIAVSEKKYPFKEMKIGSGLKIKGEYDIENRFQIYILEPREEREKWDIFPEYIGIVDYINLDKKIAHFIVDQKIHGVIHFENFNMNFNVADIFALKLTSHTHDRETQYTVLTCQPTNKEISISTAKRFKSKVRISNGLGFMEDDIFIDRHFVDHYKINDGDCVEGLAVLNFNKKKGIWGWKMIQITEHIMS